MEVLPSSTLVERFECFPRRDRFSVVERAADGSEYTLHLYDATGQELWSSLIRTDSSEGHTGIGQIQVVGSQGELWAYVYGDVGSQVHSGTVSVTLANSFDNPHSTAVGAGILSFSSTGEAVAARTFPEEECRIGWRPEGSDAHGRAFGWCPGASQSTLMVLDENLDELTPGG